MTGIDSGAFGALTLLILVIAVLVIVLYLIPVRIWVAAFASGAYVGLFTVTSLALIPWIVPSILIGVPIGAFVIRRVDHETFRRICMSFDAWVVGFGLSKLLNDLHLVNGKGAYLVLLSVLVIDAWLLYRFFAVHDAAEAAPAVAADYRPAEVARSD